MESVIDNVKLAKIVDQERKKLFLAGLNPELDQIRGQIIGQKSLLSLRDVYAWVPDEEIRKVTLNYPLINEGSTLKTVVDGAYKAEQKAGMDKGSLGCD